MCGGDALADGIGALFLRKPARSELGFEPMSAIRQSESRTRFLATADALEALGAYRPGDRAQDQDAAYRETIGYVDLYLETWRS